MPLRVVLYAEGAGETGGTARGMPPAPGEPLGEDWLGPGHVLVRRAISLTRGLEQSDISFESPLRTRRGLIARGSELHDRQTLRQLLSWPRNQPDLAVVLVDADGDNGRMPTMTSWVADLPVDLAIGVAAQEFEAWLIADLVAVSTTLDVVIPQPPAPESLKPREAKKWLGDRIDEAGVKSRDARLRIANELDLDRLKGMCRSFEELLGRLRRRTG